MTGGERTDEGTVAEKQTSRVKPPPVYQVVLLNDDFTPMEFVVGVSAKILRQGARAGDPDHAEGAS
jgi:ATP-dependent Clp protease adaptor protein ClpS